MCTLFCKQKAERVRGSRPSARAKLSHQNREQQTETSDRQPMAKRTRNRKSPSVKPMLFTPGNYKLMGMGVLLVIVGFTIMRIENEVYGFISLYISPVIILAGYGIAGYAIVKRDFKKDESLNRTSDQRRVYNHLFVYVDGYGRRPHMDLAGDDPCRYHSMCGNYTEQDLSGCPEGCNPRRYLRLWAGRVSGCDCPGTLFCNLRYAVGPPGKGGRSAWGTARRSQQATYGLPDSGQQFLDDVFSDLLVCHRCSIVFNCRHRSCRCLQFRHLGY